MRDKSKEAILERTFALVTYHLSNPSAQQKKKVQRLISRSISIRLRPGVLLFPYLRVKDHRKYFANENMMRLLNSKAFTTEILKINAEASRFTHLRVAGERSLSLVNSALERTFLRKCNKLSEKAVILREAVNNLDIPTLKLKQQYSSLFQQYKDSKMSYDAIQKLMILESEYPFKRIYDKLLRIRKLISERNGG
jgi:hypothetical protein